MQKNKFIILFGLITILAIIATNLWVTDSKNYFLADDYNYLQISQTSSFSQIFHLLPDSRYNDRPVGSVLIKIMYQLFGLHYRLYHIVLLIIHLLNSFLVYLLVRQILMDINLQESKYFPILAAAIFGIWPKSLHTVSWIAAIFDIFGATLFLIVLNLFIYRKKIKWKYFVQGLMIIFFFLALRTKEMTIIAPTLILLYELFLHLYRNPLSLRNLGNFRPSGISIILFLISIGYFLYLNFMTNQAFTLNPNEQYYFTYNPIVIVKNFILYWYLYFDFSKVEGAQDVFVGFNVISATISFLTLASLMIWSLFKAIRKNYILLFIFASLFVSLLPILPMKNFQHILYLYMPSIFFSLLLATVIIQRMNRYAKRQISQFIILLFVLGGLYSLTLTDSVQFRRNFRLMMGENNLTTANDLSKLPKPSKNSTIYVNNISDGLSSINIGPGKINNIIFNDQSLRTILNPNSIDKSKPYMILEYTGKSGEIKLLEKSSI